MMACRRYLLAAAVIWISYACSGANCQAGKKCSGDGDCQTGLYCSSCPFPSPSVCVRDTASDPFKLVSGVRAFMLDVYDFKDDVWLCHSFEGQCYDFTAFEPAVDTLKEIEGFLASNPTEIVTLILEDYVSSPNGLTRVLNESGLSPYLFPVSKMPTPGRASWPLVSDMIANNHRLLVFTSVKSKQYSEGIAYQWNFMVESHYGNDGMEQESCENRGESAPMNDKSKSLVLVNYFRSIPTKELSCSDNSATNLINKLQTCFSASGNRWANFIAVDYYRRSDGGGVFEALDKLNGQLLCGSDDVHACTHKQ